MVEKYIEKAAIGDFMGDEKPEIELARLKREQEKARRDEVFGGLSVSERQEYEARHERMKVLRANALALAAGQANQQRAWERTAETDTPQAEARQPYRSREENSSKAYTDSQAASREVKRSKPD